jgi:murein DD-endopeptidase MepM/ murein hydrolase activator NlpD
MQKIIMKNIKKEICATSSFCACLFIFLSLLTIPALDGCAAPATLNLAPGSSLPPSQSPKEGSSEIIAIPNPIDRGGPGRVILTGSNISDNPQGLFDNRPISFFPTKLGFTGLFGADIMLKPGIYPLKVTFSQGQSAQSLEIQVEVRDKAYGIRDIKVPQNQVELSKEDLARTQKERELVVAALATQSPERLWRGEFLDPVDGSVNSSFGRQTRMNGKLNPRPHAGADFLVKEGTPVKAPADGRVILTGDHFYSGRAVYLDHGQGLISMYFHLSEISVSDGQDIKKGQILGLSGKTGRVTGAHLHYGVYLNGARLDPVPFRKMTGLLEDIF